MIVSILLCIARSKTTLHHSMCLILDPSPTFHGAHPEQVALALVDLGATYGPAHIAQRYTQHAHQRHLV
jgi:hypothetical protein